MKNPPWTKEEDDILKKNFKILPLKDLPNVLPGRNYNAIKARQTFLGICQVYAKDNNFFTIPNTLNSSIAGFTSSDGHISPPKGKRRTRIFWGINTKDRKLLEYINFYLKSNYTISDVINERHMPIMREGGKAYNFVSYVSHLCIASAETLADDLLTHWNIPAGAKSLVIGAPNITDLDICLAYIKGLIIGDGTILATDLGDKVYIKLSMLGTVALLNWCKSTLERFLGETMDTVHVRPERKGANISILTITGLKASRIIHKLNQLENTLKLDRKFKKPEILKLIERDKLEYPELFR